MKTQKQVKETLIEQFGVHFEKFYNLPPLAARIFSTIIINSREKDLTFEEILTITNASKSSVSTNIHLLLNTGKIEYYTICGDRKKYFKPASLTERIKQHLSLIRSEQNLIQKLKKYETDFNKPPITTELQNAANVYREYIDNLEVLITNIIHKIEELEK